MSYETKLLWKKRLLMLWCCFVDVHNLMIGWVSLGFWVYTGSPGFTQVRQPRPRFWVLKSTSWGTKKLFNLFSLNSQVPKNLIFEYVTHYYYIILYLICKLCWNVFEPKQAKNLFNTVISLKFQKMRAKFDKSHRN